jgi:hypothetical protein
MAKKLREKYLNLGVKYVEDGIQGLWRRRGDTCCLTLQSPSMKLSSVCFLRSFLRCSFVGFVSSFSSTFNSPLVFNSNLLFKIAINPKQLQFLPKPKFKSIKTFSSCSQQNRSKSYMIFSSQTL